ncbi:unnamed protein product [Dibothriocephalus latus]|uniref:Uncharacterized protein n=1 Tax=Dibothriocephalus latus TaxID=60516 RepID=A0A3P7MYU8_DIBLA|nr:unnamed protein product [Dibothriocephalus latus]
MMSSPYVDNASLFGLMERCLKSLSSDIEVPQILSDLLAQDTYTPVVSGYNSQKASLIYDLLSVGLTEVVDEGQSAVNAPALSKLTQPNHLDAFDVAMRKQVKMAIEQSHASTLTAASAREQDWATIKELLWPIADRLSMSGTQLLEVVFQLLTSDRSNDDIQNELLDLLGLDHFDAVSNLITDRAAWALWYKRYRIDPLGVQNDGDSQQRTRKGKVSLTFSMAGGTPRGQKNPSLAPRFLRVNLLIL